MYIDRWIDAWRERRERERERGSGEEKERLTACGFLFQCRIQGCRDGLRTSRSSRSGLLILGPLAKV